MRKLILLFILFSFFLIQSCNDSTGSDEITGPDWIAIKTNAQFYIPDSTYGQPYIQPIQVGGWEDGLYITRDGLNLYAIYLPMDVFSLYEEFLKTPECFDYTPYFRPPGLGIDLISNPWGCPTFFQGDIILSSRENITEEFQPWENSNLKRSISNEGGACAVIKDSNNFDVFVFTQNRNDIEDMDIMFMKDVSRNPSILEDSYRSIVSTTGVEDNPHIERIDDNRLLIFFDRDRYMYYSQSRDNGETWDEASLFTGVLNAQSPYDVQPHLWNDGSDWWVFFCADNPSGVRSIYKSKQLIEDDWDSWGEKELVIAPKGIEGNSGIILGLGEPSLTTTGEISFVVIYGDPNSKDKTDVFDCDPWFLPRR